VEPIVGDESDGDHEVPSPDCPWRKWIARTVLKADVTLTAP
jgi:hypothetical protein